MIANGIIASKERLQNWTVGHDKQQAAKAKT